MRTNQPIRPGDIVAYRATFLRSIGVYTGEICFARGEVKRIDPLGPKVFLAVVEWEKDNMGRVNVANLVRVNSPEFSYE